jgi:hypothetical protein
MAVAISRSAAAGDLRHRPELTQWTRLRRWGPRNRAMLEDWLADSR